MSGDAHPYPQQTNFMRADYPTLGIPEPARANCPQSAAPLSCFLCLSWSIPLHPSSFILLTSPSLSLKCPVVKASSSPNPTFQDGTLTRPATGRPPYPSFHCVLRVFRRRQALPPDSAGHVERVRCFSKPVDPVTNTPIGSGRRAVCASNHRLPASKIT